MATANRSTRSTRSRTSIKPVTAVRRLFADVISKGDVAALGRLVDKGVTIHGASPDDETGVLQLGKFVRIFHGALPRLRVSLESVIEAGDVVICRWSAHGSITDLWPLPIVDVDVPGVVSVFRVHEGRIVEIWGLDVSFDPSDYEESDDDGPVGGAPPGPRWVPPEPKPRRRVDDGAR